MQLTLKKKTSMLDLRAIIKVIGDAAFVNNSDWA